MRFVSVENMVKFIQDKGLENVLTELAQYIESDYKRWDEFDKSPRYASHSKGGVIELMPTADSQQFSFKYVNGHPGNFKKGLQTVVAFGVLSDVDSGYPLLLSEMTIGTALRTAAMSAVAAKHLANPNISTMGMIGAGCQAEFQAHAFRAITGINNLRVYDIDPEVSKKFAKNMEGRGFNITVCPTSQDAVMGCDVITTCTADKQYATVLSDNMVGQGMHINAIGGDCPGKTELHPDILKRGSVFVEFEPQSRIEGEIQHMPDDFPVTEVFEIFRGEKGGRQNEREITIFDSVGFALQDFSMLRYLFEKTEGTEYYDTLNIIAELDDPRNLFGLFGEKTNDDAPKKESA